MHQRIPWCAGGAVCIIGAACGAALAGGGVTLRCVPTERPPPRRLASASVATKLAPMIAMQIPSNHLAIKETSEDHATKIECRDARPLRPRRDLTLRPAKDQPVPSWP